MTKCQWIWLNKGMTTTPAPRPRCAICDKIRKLVGWSSLDKWMDDPDICFGCSRGLAGGGTQCGSHLV